jgi:osmoprotectant transport system ATP-binding protein
VTDFARPALEFENVVVSYGAGDRGVDGVTFTVPPGRFAVILGPSGCGKTTLMKTVNRLLDLKSGRVLLGGADVATLDAVRMRRGIGYAIQQVGLFPHMTVAANVAVVPALLGWERTRIARRVDELLDLVNLPAGEFRHRYPRQLSGGQQQRVGLARALAGDPALLLMDEPFGAVDAIERVRLQTELSELQRRLKKTVLFVTHDVDEALRLADMIVIMRDGRAVQTGSPADILFAPVDPFVAALVGADDALRRLSSVDVEQAVAVATADGVAGPALLPSTTLRDALARMIDSQVRIARVVDDRGATIGSLSLDAIFQAARRGAGRPA